MSSPAAGPARVSAIVLAYGAEPLLVRCVESILASEDVEADVVVVDNGGEPGQVATVAELAGVTVVRPGRNLGFAAGANAGAAAAEGDVVAFVNSDVIVRPGALRALVDALDDPAVGLASASVRLMRSPELINSSGNPVHYLGLSWAGGLGDPAEQHAEPRDVTVASGAAVACTRATWERLEGFYEPMFLYHEDTELSVRCWLQGLAVRYVPQAVVEHDYDFSRNASKWELMERNRLIFMFTLWEKRTLRVLMPAIVGLELALFAVAVKQGWWRAKIRGWTWLLRNRSLVSQRRRHVAGLRRVPDRDVLRLMTARFEPGAESGVSAPAALQAGSAAYWRIACRILGVRPLDP